MKKWTDSKTVWLGVLVALISFVQAIQPLVTDPKVLGYIGGVIGFLTVLARVLGSNVGK